MNFLTRWLNKSRLNVRRSIVAKEAYLLRGAASRDLTDLEAVIYGNNEAFPPLSLITEPKFTPEQAARIRKNLEALRARRDAR